ncbi:MAG TPA: potassium-transporting ATPase subunit KdpC [Tepidisphaeraceae bacterium]|nr:potassium-transporting ATPase subunit KdpC [Tepidisphaeraceae bacterium]
MRSQLRPAVMSFVLLTLITGVCYPLAVTGAARVALADKAQGSVIHRDGRAVGSSLIGQPFSDPRYFWPRPSATSPVPYAADAGAGSNLAPTNPALAEAVKQRIAALRAADPQNDQPVPVDLVTASASGLDPHITLAAAEYQLSRVARSRQLPETLVRQLVGDHTEVRSLGVLGEARVNVLKLNLALDARP